MELETDEETTEKFAPNDEEAEVDNVICKEIDNDAFNVEEFAKVLGSATTTRKRLQDNVEKEHYYVSSLPETPVQQAARR